MYPAALIGLAAAGSEDIVLGAFFTPRHAVLEEIVLEVAMFWRRRTRAQKEVQQREQVWSGSR